MPLNSFSSLNILANYSGYSLKSGNLNCVILAGRSLVFSLSKVLILGTDIHIFEYYIQYVKVFIISEFIDTFKDKCVLNYIISTCKI